MPSQPEVRWSRLKSGVIVLGSAAVLIVVGFLMTTASGVGMFSHRLTVTSYFDDTSGLKPGAAVTLEGITIGTVKTITVVAGPEHKSAPVMVTMKLDSKYESDLHTDSTTSLATAGVLGDTAVDISSQFAAGPPLRDGDELKTLATPSLYTVEKSGQATVNNLKGTLQRMDGLVDTIQTGKGSVGKLMNDPQFVNQMNATAAEVSKLTAKLNSTDNSVGKLVNGPKSPQLTETFNRVSSITTDIGNGKGSVGKALHDPDFQKNLSAARVNVNAAMADADKGSLGMMLKDPTVTKKMADTLTQTNTLLSNINQGKGTLGKLSTTQANLTQFETEGGALLADIRKNPKRVFSIQFRIF